MSDVARLETFELQLRGLADEMGAVLVRSAVSSNIKERRDTSTAIFDAKSQIVAQAAHIPVHLGSMHSAVAAVADAGAAADELWLLNDPYAGGTHLPDITLVRPIADSAGTLLGYACCRAHHADVGGEHAGSMFAGATHIDQEGVRIAATRVGRAGILDLAAVAPLIAPMRQPDERRGDLHAQAAALHVAAERLPLVAGRRGGAAAFATMARELLDHGERRCSVALEAPAPGTGVARRTLELPAGVDVDAVIRCTVRLGGGRLTVDLRDSSPQVHASFNCPRPVTLAAVMFVVRSIFDPDMPTSAGSTRPVEVLTTPGTIVDATWPAAVAAGNVEVSSVLVDVVTGALGALVDVPADGQGTMNNVVIGNDRFSYYETIAGGQGAGAGYHGASAVQVAMTNTHNTPIEALELQFPLQAVQYSLRRGSGGEGRYRGGDGVVRALRVLEDCELHLLSQRRLHGPHGRGGGGDGAPGEQYVDGEAVAGTSSHHLRAGSVVEVRTPGGGGYGTS